MDVIEEVLRLFRERGWTTFISDRLVFRVLLLANLGVAAVTGANQSWFEKRMMTWDADGERWV